MKRTMKIISAILLASFLAFNSLSWATSPYGIKKIWTLFALLLGETEIAEKQVTVKDLRGEAGQQTIAQSELGQWLTDNLS